MEAPILYLFNRASDGQWIFGKNTDCEVAAGQFRIVPSEDRTTVDVYQYKLKRCLYYRVPVTNFKDENGNSYATFNDLKAAYLGFAQQGTLLNLKIPTGFSSAFTVDTILGQLNWTDANSGIAEYEIYAATNGGSEVLIATTEAGATSYQDATCKQNASVVYKIRAKKGTKFSDLVSATALSTPLCWKTNQSVLTPLVIGELKLIAGKTVNINWGDGTNANYSGDNVNVTKNYSVTGQYNISITGDINFIYSFKHESQLRSIGVITNWILPTSLITASLYASGLTGDTASLTIPASCISFQLPNTLLSGSILNIEPHETNVLNFQAQSSYFTDCAAITFRKAMFIFNIGNQNAVFSTTNIDKTLKSLADWYQVNVPISNCTFTLSGSNMGIPTGGASNTDITRLVGYYTAAGKSCTILVRTS